MPLFGWLITVCWAVLVVYWCISGVTAVRNLGTRWLWWREITLRLGFFAAVTRVLPDAGFNTNTMLGLAGLLLCAIGVSLAIGARVSLGAGWSAPTPGRELITTGPYTRVRHPLYGGLFLAMLGSALGQSVLWWLPLIVYGPGFVLSARREERLLIEQSPERYRDYMRQTKMFVPFLI